MFVVFSICDHCLMMLINNEILLHKRISLSVPSGNQGAPIIFYNSIIRFLGVFAVPKVFQTLENTDGFIHRIIFLVNTCRGIE